MMPLASRIQRLWAPLALLAAAVLTVPAASARSTAEDKVPGFEKYAPVQITSIYWKDKHWERRDSITVDLLDGFKPAPEPRCEFGGLESSKVGQATGFFHAAKVGGRWTLVDPCGHRFLILGMGGVGMNSTERGQKALKAKFGDEHGWARATTEHLRSMGFNMLGCWSEHEVFQAAGCKIPYTVVLNWMSGYGGKLKVTYTQPGHKGYPNNCILVFDPGFEAYCNEEAQKLAQYKNDPWCFGYFSDNEMPLELSNLEGYLKFKEGDAGRAAAEKFLTERYGKVDPKRITEKDREDFLKIVTERYFRIVNTAIKKVDPNHLYLGPRLHGASLRQPFVFAAAAPHVDVMAVNYYMDWSPNYAHTLEWSKAMDKPYFITEYYAKGMDSGLANTSGAGWTVKTQKDRGMFYQNFGIGLLGDPGCVGWHYFKYQDNDPTNKKVDPSNRDSNKGYMTSLYEPYPDMVDAMRQLNVCAYGMRDYLLNRQGK